MKKKRETFNYSVTMDAELAKKLDDFCEKQNMSRSGATCLAVKQYLQSVEAMPSAFDVLKNFSSFLANFSGMDKEEKKKALDEIESEARATRDRALGK